MAPTDAAAHDRLLAAHLKMIEEQATARRGRGLDPEDLVQEGLEALLAANADSEPAAIRRLVEDAMERALATEAAAVEDGRQMVEAAVAYERVQLQLASELGRRPTLDEIAAKLEWTVDRTEVIAELVDDARRRHDEELVQYLDEIARGEGAG